jgi:hypothetical protein
LVPPESKAVLPSRSKQAAVAFATIGGILLLGLLHLKYPFTGDQALFALGAQRMQEGAVLYRDFWDLKQPGIFVFFFLAERLAGLSVDGIHVIELIYLLAFCIVLQLTLRRYYRFWWTASIVPLLVVGLYYANAQPIYLTQVESLAGFPIYVSLYLVLRGSSEPRYGVLWYSLAGLAGAVALSLKLLFLPLLLAIWITAIVSCGWSLTQNERLRLYRSAAALPAFLLAGTAAWLIPTVRASGTRLVYDTFVAYPLYISSHFARAPFRRLSDSFAGYAAGMPAVLALGALSLWRARLWRNPLFASSIAWLCAGALVILMQRQSWWSYQFQLLDVPVGILAAFGIERVVDRGVMQRWGSVRSAAALSALFVLVAAPTIWNVSHAIRAVTQASGGGSESQYTLDRLLLPGDQAYSETRFLIRRGARTGDIYVCGDPRFYLLAHRMPALSISGWSLEFLVPAQWTSLTRQLEDRKPPYVFVSWYYALLIKARAPQFASVLLAQYQTLRHDATGDWYIQTSLSRRTK